MNGYIQKVILNYGHPHPSKAQLSPHKHCEVIYGAKEQFTHEDDTSLPLDNQGTKRIQGIIGAFLYYDKSVDNKLLVGLSSIGSQQAAATERTNKAINQILDYCATYPANGILYRSSDMVRCAHSDAGFYNESKGRSRAGAHSLLSKNNAMPRWNGSVLTLAQIIKLFISSASEVELRAIFITAQEMVAMINTLEEMEWTHPKSPIQIDNFAVSGVVNNTIGPRKIKTMDRRLHWLRCREAQGQFRYYWAIRSLNWGDYSTKNHLPLYH